MMQRVVNMVYICDNCGARFGRTDQQNPCSDCFTLPIRWSSANTSPGWQSCFEKDLRVSPIIPMR